MSASRRSVCNEAERIELYEIVLTDGTAEDVCRYVNREELLRLWPRCGCRPTYDKYGSHGLVLSPRQSGPLHEHIARIALALPEARQVALAGGGAMPSGTGAPGGHLSRARP
jgi:hypothetical protein